MKFLLLALAVNAARYLTVDEPIEGQYIVVFKKHLTKGIMAAHKEVAALKNVEIAHEYGIGEFFNGYAGKMDQTALNFVLDSEEVDYVTQDGWAHAMDYFEAPKVEQAEKTEAPGNDCITQTGATWGLVRTAQRNLNIDGNYAYALEGDGVTCFIIDTGIYVAHTDFNGRASWGRNFIDADDSDGNGHGTHVAGTIGGTKYGMAKNVRLVAVKVLNAGGSGAWSGVISGIQWVANDTRRPKTANMSLGGGRNQAVNDAVDAAVRAGVVIVNAAGNNNQDTCNFSPAGAPLGIAVGATDNADRKATFSNHGPCMTLFAPGVSITSDWIGSPTGDNTISGTSMAAPHVCGMVAKYLEIYPNAAPDLVKQWLKDTASGNLVKGVDARTANLLLFGDCNIQSGANVTKLPNRYSA